MYSLISADVDECTEPCRPCLGGGGGGPRVNSNEAESRDALWSVDDCREWLRLDEDENCREAGLERPEEVAEVDGDRRHRGDNRISRGNAAPDISPASDQGCQMVNFQTENPRLGKF
jgi:hypothetical protein